MHVAKSITTGEQRIAEVPLLNIHVVHVSVNHDVGLTNQIDVVQRLLHSVQQIALVPIDELKSDANPTTLCLLGDLPNDRRAVATGQLGRGRVVLVQGPEDDPAKEVRTDSGRQVKGAGEDVAASGYPTGVLAVDIAGSRQSQAHRCVDSRIGEGASCVLHIDHLRVHARDLDEVVPD